MIPAVPSSRAESGARGVESGLHGLESEANVRFKGLRVAAHDHLSIPLVCAVLHPF